MPIQQARGIAVRITAYRPYPAFWTSDFLTGTKPSPACGSKKTIKHIHEGKYVADVEVDLRYGEIPWDPTLELAEVEKLDRVRLALRRNEIAAAAKEEKLYELRMLAGE